MELTQDEEKFVTYWKENRLKRKKIFRQLAVGLPLAVVLVIAIFVNFFSGWYKRAQMTINTDTSLIPVLLIAAIGIVVFIVVFSARHRWDMSEQRYLELISKRNQD